MLVWLTMIFFFSTCLVVEIRLRLWTAGQATLCTAVQHCDDIVYMVNNLAK